MIRGRLPPIRRNRPRGRPIRGHDTTGRHGFERYSRGTRDLAIRSEGDAVDVLAGPVPEAPGDAIARGLAAVGSTARASDYLACVGTEAQALALATAGVLVDPPVPKAPHELRAWEPVRPAPLQAPPKVAPPRAAEDFFMLGHQRLRERDADGALDAFADALERDPGFVPAQLARLDLLAHHAEAHLAAVAAGRALRARGVGGLGVWRPLGYSLQELGLHEEAAEVFAEALFVEPESEADWYNLACSHARLQRGRRVVVALDTAVRLLPANGALAREDDDFRSVRAERWFTQVTDPDAPRRPDPAPVRVGLFGVDEALGDGLREALGAYGHTVERGARDADRLLVEHGAVELDSLPEGPPLAVLSRRPRRLAGVPTVHVPERWGIGTVGVLRAFLGPLAELPRAPLNPRR